MKKRDELAGAPGACLPKVADDEPIFILRATDQLAPLTVKFWLSACKAAGVALAPEKREHAEQCIKDMEAWPGRRMPD